jgi:2-polyprenyl-3-methyl-5-hydroxy-6-metoxy-1,4-benzoquinol methylase
MDSKSSVYLNQYGYYTLANKPSKDELALYYEKKYYQDSANSYEQTYTEAEIRYFQNKIEQKFAVVERALRSGTRMNFLDIGCGEGWALDYFLKKGWNVTGLDFSKFACEKFNPECSEFLVAGDIYENLNKLIASGRKFELVWLDNVLEHVLEPEQLVNNLHAVLSPGGILVVEVPNDFSIIQQHALKQGLIDREFWIVSPDHVSYFNKEGLSLLFEACNWTPVTFMADFPVDWSLFNADTNYIQDKTKGKNCHLQRVELENLFSTLNHHDLINLYESLAKLGLGRQITGFFKSNF